MVERLEVVMLKVRILEEVSGAEADRQGRTDPPTRSNPFRPICSRGGPPSMFWSCMATSVIFKSLPSNICTAICCGITPMILQQFSKR